MQILDDDFKKEIEALHKKVASRKITVEEFSLASLKDFCYDINIVIPGTGVYLVEAFSGFYKTIGCNLQGAQIKPLNIPLDNSSGLPELFGHLEQLTAPSAIDFEFYLEDSWVDYFPKRIVKVVSVHFQVKYYEVVVVHGNDEEIRIRKNYYTNLLNEEVLQIRDKINSEIFSLISKDIDN